MPVADGHPEAVKIWEVLWSAAAKLPPRLPEFEAGSFAAALQDSSSSVANGNDRLIKS